MQKLTMHNEQNKQKKSDVAIYVPFTLCDREI